MNVGLWSSLSAPVAYAIPCGVNCENITTPPTVAVTLNGVDQTASYALALSLNNLSILGWNVTLTSTQFATGAIPVRTLPTTASSVTNVTAVCTAGQICTTTPQNAVTYPLAVPAGNSAPTPVKLYDAQIASGVGTFDLSATIKVTVPANAYAGTYTSTITLAYVSGP
jgi:hypothetical protein